MDYNFRKILIIHPGGIGDLIMFTPVIKILKNNFPSAKIDIFAGYTPISADIFKEGRIVNRIFKVDFSENTLFDKLKFIFQLRKENYDLSLLPAGADYLKSRFVNFLIGAKVGLSGGGGDKKKHKTDLGIDLLGAIGLKIGHEAQAPFIDFDEEKKLADDFLKANGLEGMTLIGLHPDRDRHQKFKGFKRWPGEYFILLGKKILTDLPSAFIVIFGGPDEKGFCRDIQAKLNGGKRVVTAAGYSLRQETALIDRCMVFVGSDSGLAHAASTTKTNLIAIFGPTDEKITGPRGDRVHIIKEKCHLPYDINDRRFKRGERSEPCDCLKKITPDRVFNKIKEILHYEQ